MLNIAPVEILIEIESVSNRHSAEPIILPVIILSLKTGCVKSTFIEPDFTSWTIASKPSTIPIIGAKMPTVLAIPPKPRSTPSIPITFFRYSTSNPF